MSVSLESIKILRERLGAGMVDSKKALIEADGDIEKAVEILRVKGLKGVAKREGRSTSEGLIAVEKNNNSATMIELACETDFVAKNQKFIDLAEKIVKIVDVSDADNVQESLNVTVDSKTVEEIITDEAAIIGEKIELRRVVKIFGDNIAVYLHKTSKDLPPQLGVVVSYSGENSETATNICQHISFADPKYLNKEDVPQDEVEKERKIITEISVAEGKPEAALPKIIEGRLNGFYKQVVLSEQEYVRDNKTSIAKVLGEAGITIQSFSRFKVGA